MHQVRAPGPLRGRLLDRGPARRGSGCICARDTAPRPAGGTTSHVYAAGFTWSAVISPTPCMRRPFWSSPAPVATQLPGGTCAGGLAPRATPPGLPWPPRNWSPRRTGLVTAGPLAEQRNIFLYVTMAQAGRPLCAPLSSDIGCALKWITMNDLRSTAPPTGHGANMAWTTHAAQASLTLRLA